MAMSTLEYSQDIVIKEEVHSCNFGPYLTNSGFLLGNHMEGHELPINAFNCEENALEVYNCKDCNFTSHLLIFLKNHMQQIHHTTTENGSEFQTVEYALKSFTCSICTFKTYSSLRWLKHLKVECPDEAQRPQIPSENSKWFVCEHCLYRTKTKKYLSSHMQHKHGEQDSFECNCCDFKTNSKTNLDRHLFRMHTPSESFLYCDQCSFKTPSLIGLKRHKHKKHEQESHLEAKLEWYLCMHCPFKTKDKYWLACHEICRHKPDDQINWLKCDHCEYKAKYKQNLNDHVRIRHREWNDTDLFHCDKCSYKTKKKLNLTRHKVVHLASKEVQWFHCDKCSFKTRRKESVTRHNISQHLASEEIQWFQCDKCTYKAKIRENLTYHKTSRHKNVT